MKTINRKTRSDKFPLTFHPSGQYCKKIWGIFIILVLIENRPLKAISIRQYFFMGIIAPNKKPQMET